MAKDELDIDDMEFDLDEEMDLESLMGGKTYPEPKNSREAVEQSAVKTFDGFTKEFTDKPIDEVATEFISKAKINAGVIFTNCCY